MKFKHHVAFSLIISGILYTFFKSWGLAISSFISGIFTDLDHIIDYFLDFGWHFNYKEFFHFFYEEKHQKITLILHGWEILIILFIVARLTNWNLWATGILIGYGHHFILDILFNSPNLLGLSIFWRYKRGFDSEAIYPKYRKSTRKKNSG